mmetsp:Transcript_2182/g.6520  ORF Transcript_2182/g.6520 Transcript_2182/m.6520 type:complete len:346 (+) Transcript_2182:753-1790(+)
MFVGSDHQSQQILQRGRSPLSHALFNVVDHSVSNCSLHGLKQVHVSGTKQAVDAAARQLAPSQGGHLMGVHESQHHLEHICCNITELDRRQKVMAVIVPRQDIRRKLIRPLQQCREVQATCCQYHSVAPEEVSLYSNQHISEISPGSQVTTFLLGSGPAPQLTQVSWQLSLRWKRLSPQQQPFHDIGAAFSGPLEVTFATLSLCSDSCLQFRPLQLLSQLLHKPRLVHLHVQSICVEVHEYGAQRFSRESPIATYGQRAHCLSPRRHPSSAKHLVVIRRSSCQDGSVQLEPFAIQHEHQVRVSRSGGLIASGGLSAQGAGLPHGCGERCQRGRPCLVPPQQIPDV